MRHCTKFNFIKSTWNILHEIAQINKLQQKKNVRIWDIIIIANIPAQIVYFIHLEMQLIGKCYLIKYLHFKTFPRLMFYYLRNTIKKAIVPKVMF